MKYTIEELRERFEYGESSQQRSFNLHQATFWLGFYRGLCHALIDELQPPSPIPPDERAERSKKVCGND